MTFINVRDWHTEPEDARTMARQSMRKPTLQATDQSERESRGASKWTRSGLETSRSQRRRRSRCWPAAASEPRACSKARVDCAPDTGESPARWPEEALICSGHGDSREPGRHPGPHVSENRPHLLHAEGPGQGGVIRSLARRPPGRRWTRRSACPARARPARQLGAPRRCRRAARRSHPRSRPSVARSR
jgi:hypothetical protein